MRLATDADLEDFLAGDPGPPQHLAASAVGAGPAEHREVLDLPAVLVEDELGVARVEDRVVVVAELFGHDDGNLALPARALPVLVVADEDGGVARSLVGGHPVEVRRGRVAVAHLLAGARNDPILEPLGEREISHRHQRTVPDRAGRFLPQCRACPQGVQRSLAKHERRRARPSQAQECPPAYPTFLAHVRQRDLPPLVSLAATRENIPTNAGVVVSPR